jgi:hypothetical protein
LEVMCLFDRWLVVGIMCLSGWGLVVGSFVPFWYWVVGSQLSAFLVVGWREAAMCRSGSWLVVGS